MDAKEIEQAGVDQALSRDGASADGRPAPG